MRGAFSRGRGALYPFGWLYSLVGVGFEVKNDAGIRIDYKGMGLPEIRSIAKKLGKIHGLEVVETWKR